MPRRSTVPRRSSTRSAPLEVADVGDGRRVGPAERHRGLAGEPAGGHRARGAPGRPRPPRRASRRGRAGRSGSRAWSRVCQRARRHGGLRSYNPPPHGAPPRRPAAVLPRARGAGPRALARARRLPRVGPPPPGRRAVGLLGGPADGQRQARAPITSSRACSRTSTRATRRCAATRSSARAAGTRHGLPVEIAVQQQLGIENKQEIEEFGIAEFNQRCREAVFEYLEDWNALTERIGFWIDLDDAYRTLDATYIESVWWALRQIHDKGLLYEGHKVVPYCPRCGTALSSHEVALGYEDVVDPSVYVRLPGGRGRRPAAGRRRAARVDHDAVDARLQRRGGRRPRARLRARQGGAARRARSSWPRRWSSACSAPKACRSSTASRARRSTACATSRPSPT